MPMRNTSSCDLTTYEQHAANINRILTELDAELEKIGKEAPHEQETPA
ncbi:MAG: hypothetical protein ACI4WX_00680 [Aristaeellaceae bacterium]